MRLWRKNNAEGKRRFFPLIWTAGLAAAAIVALGVSGTLSAFMASITNTNNHVQSAGPAFFGFSEGLVVDNEQTRVCASASAGEEVDCPLPNDAAFNKYGENAAAATPMAPGDTRDTTVQLTNTARTTAPGGGTSGNLTLVAGPCSEFSNPPDANQDPGDLCGTILVTIDCNWPDFTEIGPITLTALATTNNGAGAGVWPITDNPGIAPGENVRCHFHVQFPADATAADLQDLETEQELTWNYNQVV